MIMTVVPLKLPLLYVKMGVLQFLTSDSQNLKSLEDEIDNDTGKKNGVEDPTKEGDINGSGEATNTNSTNRLNTVSSPVNTVSSSFTTMDPGRVRDQRNEYESVFGQDKNANSNYKMFIPVSAAESSYENLGGSTPKDTADLEDARIFGNAYDDEDVEPKKVIQALADSSWVEAMQEELLQLDCRRFGDIVYVNPKANHAMEQNGSIETRRIEANSVILAYEYLWDSMCTKWYVKIAFYMFDAQEIPDEFYEGTHFILRLTASTPMETNKALIKDEEAEDVDVHLYRSMIRSLMYLIASRPDIMFAVCACARIPSIFDLEAFSDSDYAGASLDRKSTIGCCQFLGKRLISWQCKKQTIVANSVTPLKWVSAKYVSGSVTS
ncbi:hypothetical protein Tco_1067061 [Tanacetum coccineum]|uniref:Uncharacterized protein n=1 Tax=Tanacetum coccineum TaxID=301880 RepID=A0ABQ5HBT8_9ASTR